MSVLTVAGKVMSLICIHGIEVLGPHDPEQYWYSTSMPDVQLDP